MINIATCRHLAEKVRNKNPYVDCGHTDVVLVLLIEILRF